VAEKLAPGGGSYTIVGELDYPNSLIMNELFQGICKPRYAKFIGIQQ